MRGPPFYFTRGAKKVKDGWVSPFNHLGVFAKKTITIHPPEFVNIDPGKMSKETKVELCGGPPFYFTRKGGK